ncbi:MAG: YitT family protein [Clostridia bacterium]|nr:YitT family protein [Clostridia bacterium]
MESTNRATRKKRFLSLVKYFAMLNLGILMMSVGIYFFKSTNGFATGGVSGISILLAKLFPAISQATYMLVINVVLLILGVIILGKKCGALTFYCSLMMSMENWLFEHFVALEGPITEYTLLELIYAVGLTGIGAAIIFKCNASSGGTDIVALILKKYTHMNVGEALLISDLVIAASTIFIYGIEAGLFSLLGLFAKVFVVDDLLDSMNMCKAFTIITTKAEEIEIFIMNEMHHGATVHNASGAYSGEEKKVIITVCKRTEALRLRRRVKEIDPHSFIIITKTSEIMGKGFRDV